jgi:hypothetical protein
MPLQSTVLTHAPTQGTSTLRLERTDVEAYYSAALKQPLTDYAKSEAGLNELLKAVANFG